MHKPTIISIATEIFEIHNYFQRKAIQQVDISLSIRNWLVGLYIVEYEQNGSDRAVYAKAALKELALLLKKKNIKGLDERTLRTCRNFYQVYPQIWETVSPKLQYSENEENNKWGTVSTILDKIYSNQQFTENQLSNQLSDLSLTPDVLISKLCFSHFIELLKADSALQRNFYEVQTIKNNWSVRELERAMNTLLFERTGLSTDKEVAISKAKCDIRIRQKEVVKNPYFLEFLNIEEKSYYSESDLEQAIINHLQEFLQELGRGFCFEARQKRITFDNKHYRIDLVFYNRILKCHVLFDLKVGAFDHADAGQMNMYLNYYKANEMSEGDNPPVGIILCANKNDTLVEYATTGLSHDIFVSRYLIQLPSINELKMLILKEIKNL